MADPTSKPNWTDGSPTKVVEPTPSKKNQGWIKEEKPPFQIFNWIFFNVGQWIDRFIGSKKYNVIVGGTEASERDYADMAAYIADSPSANDRLIVKTGETLSASMVIPDDIEIDIQKGVVFTTTTVFTPVIEVGDRVKINGELNLTLNHASGTIGTAVRFNGDGSHVDEISVDVINAGPGNLTNVAEIQSGKKANTFNAKYLKSAGGGATARIIKDSSGNNSNFGVVLDDPNTRVIRTRGGIRGRESSEFSNLADALTEIGATETNLFIVDAQTLTANFNPPDTLTVIAEPEGSIIKDSTFTVDIPNFIAGQHQVFSGFTAGTSDIRIGPGVSAVLPVWFGALADGSDDSNAVDLTYEAASQRAEARFLDQKTYVTGNQVVANTNSNVPTRITGNQTIFKAKVGTTGNLFQLNNPNALAPTSQFFHKFEMSGFKFDSDEKTDYGFWFEGGKHCELSNLTAIKGLKFGFKIHGSEAVGGVNYCNFRNFLAGTLNEANAEGGFDITSESATIRNANNNFYSSFAHRNDSGTNSPGFHVNFASVDFYGCGAERNSGPGWFIDNALSVGIFGGYSENNEHTGSADVTVRLTNKSNGVTVIGMRSVGIMAPGSEGAKQGNIFLPNEFNQSRAGAPNWDPNGILSGGGLRLRSTVAISGAAEAFSDGGAGTDRTIIDATAHGLNHGSLVDVTGRLGLTSIITGGLTRSGGTATAVTIGVHGFVTGQTITMAGAVEPDYNGDFVITVINPTTFTYAVGGSPSSPATGTITATHAITAFADATGGKVRVTSNAHGLIILSGSITAFDLAGNGLTQVTSAGHPLVNGQKVAITSVSGDYDGDGLKISQADTNTFVIEKKFTTTDTGSFTQEVTTTIAGNPDYNGNHILVAFTANTYDITADFEGTGTATWSELLYSGNYAAILNASDSTNKFDIFEQFIADATGTWEEPQGGGIVMNGTSRMIKNGLVFDGTSDSSQDGGFYRLGTVFVLLRSAYFEFFKFLKLAQFSTAALEADTVTPSSRFSYGTDVANGKPGLVLTDGVAATGWQRADNLLPPKATDYTLLDVLGPTPLLAPSDWPSKTALFDNGLSGKEGLASSDGSTWRRADTGTPISNIEHHVGKVLSISSLTSSGTLATAVTASAHGLLSGRVVNIDGAVEVGYDGNFNITVIDLTTFTYNMSVDPADTATGTITANYDAVPVPSDYIGHSIYVENGDGGRGTLATSEVKEISVSSITSVGTAATLTTDESHGYVSGQKATIAGVTNETDYNVADATIIVTGPKTFRYTILDVGDVDASGPTITCTGAAWISERTRAPIVSADYSFTPDVNDKPVPSASAYVGAHIIVTDEATDGQTIVYSDGTNWKRTSNGATAA